MEKAYVLLNVEIDSEKEVLDSLKEIPEVKEAHQIYAVYDLIIHIEADTSKKLNGLINRIRDIEKIRSTIALICVKKGDVQVDIGKKTWPSLVKSSRRLR